MRVFAVLAAAFLVAAFAMAILYPPDLPFGEWLSSIDLDLPSRIQAVEMAHFPAWVWQRVTLPLVQRPAWLPPAGLGLLCAGVALSFSSSGKGNPQRPRRERG